MRHTSTLAGVNFCTHTPQTHTNITPKTHTTHNINADHKQTNTRAKHYDKHTTQIHSRNTNAQPIQNNANTHSQLEMAQSQADAKNAASRRLASSGGAEAVAGAGAGAGGGAAEMAHLKKFGKLLSTFGTRTACLLRHLGPECPPRDRRKAYRLFAEASRESLARSLLLFCSAHSAFFFVVACVRACGGVWPVSRQ